MNKFYELNIVLQWLIALAMLAGMCLLMGLYLYLARINFLFYFLLVFFAPFLQFLTTPFFKLTKMYTYLSPMLLVFGANDKKYDLHSGTSFDYLFVLRGTKSGIELRKKLLKYFIEGLLNIIKKIENKELPETVIVSGSSYFFSERTANRLGFKIAKINWFLKFNLYLNYIDLLWMYSLSNGKLTFPKLSNTKSIEVVGKDLVQNKPKLESLYAYLDRN